ncbi:MAG: FAD-binding oxidoreductase [Armatimonadota bacterium]|nr:FAD-binding oxidoreductase [Armatimonadota bacterium]
MRLPHERMERVEAWGMSTASTAYVFRPINADGICKAYEGARKLGLKVAIKGAGNSYGDAFQCPEGVVIDLTRMNRVLDFDPITGVIKCEPGLTIDALWRYVIGDGWWPPVVSGTSKVTVGGALAANIHGKNNLHAGTIGEHVRAFDLLIPNGEVIRFTPDEDLFHAAIGGFGLLGAFISIELQLKKIHSGRLLVEAFASENWEQTFRIFEEQSGHDYLVGWIDAFAGGVGAGRGLIHAADYLRDGDDPHPEESLRTQAQEMSDTALGWIPKSKLHKLMSPFVTHLGMRFTNAMKFHAARRENGKKNLQQFAEFNFLLDSVPNWKFAYRPGALIQYQCFIPGANAMKVFQEVIAYTRDRGHPAYLAVMKRHREDRFLLSHGVDGYSLALDFPVTKKNREDLWALASELDRKVLSAGGRFYFAKDSTMSQATAREYLGENLQRFLEIKRKLDPEAMLQSSLSRRVMGDL